MAQRDDVHVQDPGARGVDAERIGARSTRRRAHAADTRELAAQDRRAATEDRERAARERRDALGDLETIAAQLAMAETDQLTGVRVRAAGLADLDEELERCRRTHAGLVVAYVDVDGLKAVNDREGHGAGDELLARVVQTIREHLRSYDLVVRLGGDEFLCAMSGTTLADTRRRFRAIQAALAAAPDARSVTCGFAELVAGEGAAELVDRTDREMLAARRGRSRP